MEWIPINNKETMAKIPAVEYSAGKYNQQIKITMSTKT